MKICVLLIADSALAGINYFINHLIKNYPPSFILLKAESLKQAPVKACSLRLEACSLIITFAQCPTTISNLNNSSFTNRKQR